LKEFTFGNDTGYQNVCTNRKTIGWYRNAQHLENEIKVPFIYFIS
jgi:hypothetical protein